MWVREIETFPDLNRTVIEDKDSTDGGWELLCCLLLFLCVLANLTEVRVIWCLHTMVIWLSGLTRELSGCQEGGRGDVSLIMVQRVVVPWFLGMRTGQLNIFTWIFDEGCYILRQVFRGSCVHRNQHVCQIDTNRQSSYTLSMSCMQ